MQFGGGDRPYAPFRDVAGAEWCNVLFRSIRLIAGEIFGPFGRLALAFLVSRHRAIEFRQIASGDMRAREIVQKPPDPPPDDTVQTGINIVLDCDRQFLDMAFPLMLTYLLSLL